MKRFSFSPLSSLPRLALVFALGAPLMVASARADDAQAPAHTAWAEAVRQALAGRMHHVIEAGRERMARTEYGVASWYGRKFHHRGRTSDGDVFTGTEMTAAHPTLPFGTKVRVTSEDTGRSVVVTVNDRGPFNSRIIDLSRAAAAKLGMMGSGVAHVTVSPLNTAEVAQAQEGDTSAQAVAAAATGSAGTR
ncbi:septal ring lytic transglycosylase RlpA family protein [Ameyamaea chiangmaiensis]|nr:septal ring lytic transglycosylase RlpA family protein [Ameyamaea chiangmaiensis]